MNDFIQRFHIQDSPVRGELVHLNEAFEAVLARHEYPERVQQLLGELMAASVLLSATLKFEGSLIMQVRGNGPLQTLMAECNYGGDVRAIAQIGEDWDAASSDLPLNELLGSGNLVITIDPDEGERYQGVVPLQGDTLSACIEYYFAQSEQLPTRLWLAATENAVGGLLLQVLPGANDDGEAWNRLQMLADTVRPAELIDLPVEELLHRLYHEEDVELFPAEDVNFRCTCNRERTEQALLSLGEAELLDLVREQNPIIVSCQFCHQEYRFDQLDVTQLLRGGSGSAGGLH